MIKLYHYSTLVYYTPKELKHNSWFFNPSLDFFSNDNILLLGFLNLRFFMYVHKCLHTILYTQTDILCKINEKFKRKNFYFHYM